MSSRRTVAVVVVVGMLVLAGCTGSLFSVEAAPATIPTADHEAQGYVHGNTTAIPLTYDVGVAGLSRDVTVTSWVSDYSKTTSDNRTAGLLLLSTPTVDVAGDSVNPFRRPANGALVDRVVETTTDLGGVSWLGDVTDLRRLDTSERHVLDTPTNVTTYTGSLNIDGTRTGVLVHVMTVEHEGDVVVAIAMHPESIDETATIYRLLEGVEHEKSET